MVECFLQLRKDRGLSNQTNSGGNHPKVQTSENYEIGSHPEIPKAIPLTLHLHL